MTWLTPFVDNDYPFENSGDYQHESPIPTPPVTPTSPVNERKVDSPNSSESKTLTEASEATTRVDITPPKSPKPLKTHEKAIPGKGVMTIETSGYVVSVITAINRLLADRLIRWF